MLLCKKTFTFPESPAHTVSVVDPLPRGCVGGGGREGGIYLGNIGMCSPKG